MIVHIYRESKESKQTRGSLEMFRTEKVDEKPVFSCKTLELAWLANHRKVSCIPIGRYKVEKRFSNKYQSHFWVKDVPNRDMILIHHGNFFTQTLGCILVGKEFKDLDGDGLLDITDSKKTMGKLNEILLDNFDLIIE